MEKKLEHFVLWASGLLLVLAGSLHLLRAFPLLGLGAKLSISLAIVVAGLILLALGLLGVKPGWAALLLALSSSLLVLVASGLTAIFSPGYYVGVRNVVFPVDEVEPVEAISLSCSVGTGSVKISTTGDKDIYVSVAILTVLPEEPTLTHEVKDGRLIIDISGSWCSLELLVADWLEWSANITSETGSIEASVNATCLRWLSLWTSTGSISLSVEAIGLAGNSTVEASTITGGVRAEVVIGGQVGCEIKARSTFGRIRPKLDGFRTMYSKHGSCLLRSEDFELANQVLRVALNTTMGSVDVVARRV